MYTHSSNPPSISGISSGFFSPHSGMRKSQAPDLTSCPRACCWQWLGKKANTGTAEAQYMLLEVTAFDLEHSVRAAVGSNWTRTSFALTQPRIAHLCPLFCPVSYCHNSLQVSWVQKLLFSWTSSQPSSRERHTNILPASVGRASGAGRGAAELVQAAGDVLLQRHSLTGLSCACAKQVVLLNCIFRCLKWILVLTLDTLGFIFLGW